jgi:hypothetical protein
MEDHDISADTEQAIRRYLADNDLSHVKVRLNQYAPLDDWRRLRANKTVGWGYRYTLGVTPSPNPDPSLVRESSCPDWGWKGFSDEEATQYRADRGLASAC